MDPGDWSEAYFAAYYWSCMTVTTIGYGDIVRDFLHACMAWMVVATCICVTHVHGDATTTAAQIPQTTNERVVATICMLVGASIFAYAVSAIVAVVASFGEERRQYVHLPRRCLHSSEGKLHAAGVIRCLNYSLACSSGSTLVWTSSMSTWRSTSSTPRQRQPCASTSTTAGG